MTDLRYAIRTLLKSPAFTLIAILILALGIGANSAIFTLIDNLFLHGLPFKEPNRLVRVYGEAKERQMQQMPFSVPRFWHYRDGQNVFSGLAADSGMGFILTGMGDPVQLNGGIVTANYFDVLGVRPLRGRLFCLTKRNGGCGAGQRTFLAETAGRRSAGARAQPRAQRSFDHDCWRSADDAALLVRAGLRCLDCEAFRAAGHDPRDAHARRRLLASHWSPKAGCDERSGESRACSCSGKLPCAVSGLFDSSWTPAVVPASEDVPAIASAFRTLLASVAAVLLIACSNVANLLLVRFTSRRREIALRAALGASRAGLIRLLYF